MLVGMQKINFITHFFLKILQKNSKLVILGNLGMPGHTPKMIVSIWGNIWHLSAGKKSTSSFTFSLSYFLLQIYCNLVLGTLPCTPKVILSIYRKLLCLSAGKKPISSPALFWRLVVSILPHKSRTRITKYGIGGEMSTTILAFILDYFQEKLFKFLINVSKNLKKIFWGQFGPF